MKKTIKLCDGFRVYHIHGVEEFKVFRDIFTEAFKWDLENDELAKKCYDAIFMRVFCEGRIDLTEFNHGKKLIIEAIPPTEPIITEEEE